MTSVSNPSSDELKAIADSMGITCYQRFTPTEASLFLRCSIQEITQLVENRKINTIRQSANKFEFFGFQLLEYLLSQTSSYKIQSSISRTTPDRIIRTKELQDLVSLSRTTIWRYEQAGDFPRRVSLGANSVGWRLSEVESWLADREVV